MTQQQLDREIANVTGETVRAISRRGFSLVETCDVERNLAADHPDYEQPPQYIDWDLLDQERNIAFFDQPSCRW